MPTLPQRRSSLGSHTLCAPPCAIPTSAAPWRKSSKLCRPTTHGHSCLVCTVNRSSPASGSSNTSSNPMRASTATRHVGSFEGSCSALASTLGNIHIGCQAGDDAHRSHAGCLQALARSPLDFSNAFLHGHLKERVLCQQPIGFGYANMPGVVYLLSKSLYGLKQAPHAWFT